MNTLTTDALRSIGMTARKENAILGSIDLPGKNVRGCCIDITTDVINTLTGDYRIPEHNVVQYRFDFLLAVNGEDSSVGNPTSWLPRL